MKTAMQNEGASAPSLGSEDVQPVHAFFSSKPVRVIIRLGLLAVLDAMSLLFIWTLIANGRYPLAVVIFVTTVGVNLAFLFESAYPFRWFSPGLALMIIMLAYPTGYTFYVAFTNYGDGHLLTKTQVITQLERTTYVPEGATEFSWIAYRSQSGEYALWLQSETGDFLAMPDEELTPAESVPDRILRTRGADGVPAQINGYDRLNRIQVVGILDRLSSIQFGTSQDTVRVRSLDSAVQLEQRYVYDPGDDTITDQREGTVYSPVAGTFTSADGDILRPGFWVVIGTRNFERLLTSPALRGPFVRVFIWTFVFAAVSVFVSFAVGLFFALVFDHPNMPMKRLVRALVLIPYALPAFISVNIWRGMFSRHFGIVSTTLESLFGSSPLWLADPFWAKIGILIVQAWLGFPYMMLICTGAMQSLPHDIFEAATIDGAGALRKFWHLTLPLLLVAVGPLLIASFAFNFNNFTVIDIYAEGGPPIAGTLTPAGHTDILITYIFRLAFSSGRGADFGYASAITIVIFAILTIVTALQFRYTRVWEEISENV